MIGFTDGEIIASYTYGISGSRDNKTVNGVTTTHIWINNQIVVDYVEHYDADIYLRGTNLAASYHLHQSTKSDYRYYVQNAHGDVVNLTDADGDVIKSYTYDAFGVEKNIDDSDANPFRYCGEYFDTETGTIYLRTRYYNPSIGRFISRDSYAGKNEDPLSLNRYTYCHNNPVFFIDPSGLSVDVIIYHGEGNEWYGHAEIAVNNTIYSYGNYTEFDMKGPGILVKTSKTDYLQYINNENNKQFSIYTLNLTQDDEDKIVDYYESLIEQGSIYEDRSENSGYMKKLYNLSGKYKDYNALSRNCATTVRTALFKTDSIENIGFKNSYVNVSPALYAMKVTPFGLSKELQYTKVGDSSLVSKVQTYKAGEYVIYGPFKLSEEIDVSSKKVNKIE